MMCGLLLGACQSAAKTPDVPVAVESEAKPEGRFWVNPHPYYAPGYVFDLMDDPKVENRDVFIVHDEFEMALLMAVFYDWGYMDVYYSMADDFSISKAYNYALAISPYELWWEDYDVDLGTTEPLYSTDFVYEFDRRFAVDQAIDELNVDYQSSFYSTDEKINWAYDTLIQQTEYDDAATLDPNRTSPAFEAYGALINHQSVCNGYALAFMGMMKDLNVPALTISSSTDDHAWNMVYNKGEWQYFDATFEDTDGIEDDYFYYYGLDFETMSEDGDHDYDPSSEIDISREEYLALAQFIFPQTNAPIE